MKTIEDIIICQGCEEPTCYTKTHCLGCYPNKRKAENKVDYTARIAKGQATREETKKKRKYYQSGWYGAKL